VEYVHSSIVLRDLLNWLAEDPAVEEIMLDAVALSRAARLKQS